MLARLTPVQHLHSDASFPSLRFETFLILRDKKEPPAFLQRGFISSRNHLTACCYPMSFPTSSTYHLSATFCRHFRHNAKMSGWLTDGGRGYMKRACTLSNVIIFLTVLVIWDALTGLLPIPAETLSKGDAQRIWWLAIGAG